MFHWDRFPNYLLVFFSFQDWMIACVIDQEFKTLFLLLLVVCIWLSETEFRRLYTFRSPPKEVESWLKMGLSSLPASSEGVLCVILVNTALSISIVKGIIRSILHVVGIHLSSSPPESLPSDSAGTTSESLEFRRSPSDSYIEEFRSRMPTIRIDANCSCKQAENDCSVCLTQFEPESEINCLSCGHVFHKVCLEKWLKYWNVTCPLCRTSLLPEEETSSCVWWACGLE